MTNRKKNILYISSFGDMKGGGQESLYQLLKNIDRTRFNIHVIFPSEGTLFDAVKDLQVNAQIVEMCRLNILNIIKILKAIYQIAQFIKENNIDIVHTDAPRPTFYAGFAALIYNTPLIWHIRVSTPDLWLWDKFLTSLSTRLILVSEALKGRFDWLKDKKKYLVIYNGVDTNTFNLHGDNRLREELNIDKGCFIIGSIGRVEELKGQEYIIRGLKAIDNELGDYRLILIGDKDEAYFNKLRAIIDELKLAEKIIFLGQREGIDRLIPGIDIIVHPSLTEAFPRVVIESMACGKPVVASRVGGVPEAIEDNVSGFIVPPKDLSAIAEKILLLKNNSTKRHDVGRNARERAEKKFSIQTHVSEIEGIYNKLLDNTLYDFGDSRKVKIKKRVYLYATGLIYKTLFRMVGAGFSLRKITQPKGCGYQVQPGIEGLQLNLDSCKNIVIILLERIGDTVLAGPFIKSLRDRFKDANITMVVNPYTKDLLSNNPFLDEVIVYEGVIDFFKKMRGKKLDLLFDLTADPNIKTALISYFINPVYSVGYNTNSRGFLFNKAVPPSKYAMHQKDIYLYLLKSIGIDCSSDNPKIYPPYPNLLPQGYNNPLSPLTKGELLKDKIILGVCPGGFYKTQCWQEEGFAEVINILTERYKVEMFLLGGHSDSERLNNIARLMKVSPLIKGGGYSLKETISLMSVCNIMLCNNSGLLHIAAALNIPTVSIMGPTVHERWLPLGDKHIVLSKDIYCSPCNKGECELHECMKGITVKDVVDALEKQIKLYKEGKNIG